MTTAEQQKVAIKAALRAELSDIFGKRPPAKPKVVAADAVVVRDADVHVSQADPNAVEGEDRVVAVRRADWVTVDIEAWERQQAERAAERAQRRAIDPCGLGLYGPVEQDDE
jgi:hypothetical protein